MPLSSNKRSKARKPKEEPKEVPIRVVILATERLVREVADTGGSLSGAARQAIAHHLSKALRGTVVEPYFAEEELRSVRSGPLLRYFAAVVRSREEGEALVRRLQALDEVETCYVEAGPTPPPANPADDPRNPSQGLSGRCAPWHRCALGLVTLRGGGASCSSTWSRAGPSTMTIWSLPTSR